MSKERSSPEAIYIPLALILLPILYVLSVGPVAALVDRSGWPHKPFEIMYAPVEWLYDKTILRDPLEWWVSLWVD